MGAASNTSALKILALVGPGVRPAKEMPRQYEELHARHQTYLFHGAYSYSQLPSESRGKLPLGRKRSIQRQIPPILRSMSAPVHKELFKIAEFFLTPKTISSAPNPREPNVLSAPSHNERPRGPEEIIARGHLLERAPRSLTKGEETCAALAGDSQLFFIQSRGTGGFLTTRQTGP